MAKRKADDGDQRYTELEIRKYENLTPSVARNHLHVKTLRISCFVKATSPCGLPANGMAVCQETAERIPFFLVLFPDLEEVHLGGYSVDKYDNDATPSDAEPFWFSLSKEAVRCQEGDKAIIDASIGAIFDLVNSLCAAYRTGFLSTRVKILGLFDPPSFHTRYNLLCEEKVGQYGGDVDKSRDGVTCKSCRSICSSINLEQALQLQCAEEECDNLGRIQFLGCQLCLKSRSKFEVISSRPDANDDLFSRHLQNMLSDEESVRLEWYSCDGRGRPVVGGEFRSGMLRYAHGPTDSSVADEINQLLTLLAKKGKIKSSNIVTAILSNVNASNFMIDDKIFITDDTWRYLKEVVDAEDRKRFQVIDTEKYGCWGEDAIYTRKCWRDKDNSAGDILI